MKNPITYEVLFCLIAQTEGQLRFRDKHKIGIEGRHFLSFKISVIKLTFVQVETETSVFSLISHMEYFEDIVIIFIGKDGCVH